MDCSTCEYRDDCHVKSNSKPVSTITIGELDKIRRDAPHGMEQLAMLTFATAVAAANAGVCGGKS